jgi:hypothetical protein
LYEFREQEGPRWQKAVGKFFRDFPWRFARGIAGTPSSQPPSVTLRAYWDLLTISRRLISQTCDERAWKNYLEEIGWRKNIASKNIDIKDENK